MSSKIKHSGGQKIDKDRAIIKVEMIVTGWL